MFFHFFLFLFKERVLNGENGFSENFLHKFSFYLQKSNFFKNRNYNEITAFFISKLKKWWLSFIGKLKKYDIWLFLREIQKVTSPIFDWCPSLSLTEPHSVILFIRIKVAKRCTITNSIERWAISTTASTFECAISYFGH